MYTFAELERAEKFALEVLDYKGFEDIVDTKHIDFWITEIERIESAKRYHDIIELLDLTQHCIYDPFEGRSDPDPIY